MPKEELYEIAEEEQEPHGRDNLFLWTVFILLLIGVAFACWLGSFYVFGHPEQPRPYRILKKLKKLEPPKRFGKTKAPGGDFLSPQRLFERYSKLTRLELERENAELLRNYIKNFKETKKLVPYVTGRYEIIDSYELKQSDIFPTGVVALASAVDFPQVLIEHVYTSAPETVPKLRAMLPAGLDLTLERTHDLAAVIHVERTPDARLQFTVVPLLYSTYALRHGEGTFSLEPPPDINIEAGVPIIRGKTLADAMRAYADFRRKRPLATPSPAQEGNTTPQGPELVRLDTMKASEPVPETGAFPEAVVATPIPVATPRVAARPTATPSTKVAVLATPPRRAEIPVATPLPMDAPAPVPSDKPPLKPFLSTVPEMTQPNPAANWRTYAPGKQPVGRVVTPSEASALVSRGEPAERLYLRGNFVVTSSGDNRAVLRAQGASGDPRQPGSDSARIMVEYPASVAPPAMNSTFSRDDTHAFEIRNVRRGADGQITIWVREVTEP